VAGVSNFRGNLGFSKNLKFLNLILNNKIQIQQFGKIIKIMAGFNEHNNIHDTEISKTTA